MNIGNAIASIALAELLDNNTEGGGHPLRPLRRSGNRLSKPQRGSRSFADHPERW
jgi:hypothetical protein